MSHKPLTRRLRDTPAGVQRLLRPLVGLVKGTRQLAVLEGRIRYSRDGLATVHRCDFLADPRFRAAYQKGLETGSWGASDPAWRAYVCCWAAQKAVGLPGDFVECGVNRGALASTVISYVDFGRLDKRFYLLDTFRGFVPEYLTDEERRRERRSGKRYTDCYQELVKRFGCLANVVIVPGPVPDTLPLVTSERLAYLSIDMNCAFPELAAAEYFWDRLTSGAVMVLDDYGWTGHEQQKAAFDQFAQQRGVQVLALPTGQGLIFKP